MTTYRGRWAARVEQEFEIDADSEEEARRALDEEMSPGRVIELVDFEVLEFEVACERCGGTGEVVVNPEWPSGDQPFSEKCPDCQ